MISDSDAERKAFFHQSCSIFSGAKVCETAGLRLAAGAHDAYFDSDVWDLSRLADAHRTIYTRELVWDFTLISTPFWRIVAKEMLLALMAPHHEQVLVTAHALRTVHSPRTCYRMLRQLTRWFNWLAEQGISSLHAVTQDLCDRYLELTCWSAQQQAKPGRRLDPGTTAEVVRTMKTLALYTEVLSADSYRPGFVPWPGKTAAQVVGRTTWGGNRIPPVPDHVLEPLLTTCLFLVEVIGPNLADVLSELRVQKAAEQALPNLTIARIPDLLNHLRMTGTALPAASSTKIKARLSRGEDADPLVNLSWESLARLIGCGTIPFESREQLKPKLIEIASKVGFERTWARNAVHIPMFGSDKLVPWTAPLAEQDLKAAAGYAVTASLVLVAALSGMRRSELRELSVGCCKSELVAAGTGVRYKLTGRLIKGQKFGGVPDEWVVIEQVHRAVQLAEKLQDIASGEPLFTGVEMSKRIANLRRWLNDSGNLDRWGLPAIPPGPVSPRMLRRTLALSIAQRPGGLLAAKVALKHISVATTEGYAARPGGSQKVFLAEIHEAEQEHHLALTVEAFRDTLAGKMPSGPGARGLISAFHHVDAQLKDAARTDPKVLNDDRHLESLLRKLAGSLHVAPANFCWFLDPSKALCLKLAGTPEATKPLAGMCDSARCPQATHHLSHRPVWATQAQAVKVFLGSPRIARGEKQRLAVEHDRTLRVIAAIDAANSTAQEGD
ncbi:hypothetical protein [Nocardia anaemiae]|uniref:hypothetical protein n=1 Tax=Nocardia anaemiae TaxID=263910 RepID=UPI0007A3B08B|nr:hypothetical protein [Nocardia anaemiae]